MAYQVHFHWQIPAGSKVWYRGGVDLDGKKRYGITCTAQEREAYLSDWIGEQKQYEIVVARWGHGSPHWIRISQVWVEGNVCGNCGENEAPADDYLCKACRKLDS